MAVEKAGRGLSAAGELAEMPVGLIARRKARIAEDSYDIEAALQELQKKLYFVGE